MRAASLVPALVFFKILICGARPLRRDRALQELRMLAAFATALAAVAIVTRRARRPLGRVASDLALQFDDIEEDVGLAAQLVGYHRRLCGDCRHDGDAHALALDR